MSGAPLHEIAGWAAWHGRLMVLAWNIVLPLGALIARFGKVPDTRRWPARLDHPAWFWLHVRMQWAGVGVMAFAAGLALLHATGRTEVARVHHWFGWIVVGCGLAQLAMALLRGSKGGPGEDRLRGDHYDMTVRRVLFEWGHKTLGWLVVPVVWAATGLGLAVADAPRWMAVVLLCWWVALLAVFAALQRAGQCIDTYQAIWGDGAAHPGNARRPIGFGVRRTVEGSLVVGKGGPGALPLDPTKGGRP